MSDKFILFNDEKVDPSRLMMLTDLSQLILEDNEVKVKYRKFGYYDPFEKIMNISVKWQHRSQHEELYSQKSDCILYGYGQYLTQQSESLKILDDKMKHPKFYEQLFAMLEEIRLMKQIVSLKPATKKFFNVRFRIKLADNKSQLYVYKTKKVPTDLLFLQIERALLTQNVLDFNPELPELMSLRLRELIMQSSDSQYTAESRYIALAVMDILDEVLGSDMLNDYYYYPEIIFKKIKTADDCTVINRNDESDSDVNDEFIETRQKNQQSQGTYLEAEVVEGANAKAKKAEGRPGDASDEATEMLAGKGDTKERQDGDGHNLGDLGSSNQQVKIIWKKPELISNDIVQYQNELHQVSAEIRKLTTIIQKTIDHQQDARRTRLNYGRLDRHLVQFFTGDQRLFYKDNQESKELDATFTLLVDASYSMSDKLSETKRGIILFHETLKRLLIKHEIIAFNEDTFSADHNVQPNIFDHIIQYKESLNENVGPNIMTIKPQDDNRDGLAVRVAGSMLKRRNETQKFLIVFSDGEPSAFDYDVNGIIDTHDAVNQLRKEGVYVINVFLSQNAIDESTEETVRNIYGDYCVFVEGVANLPYIISPLLKKLLLQSLS